MVIGSLTLSREHPSIRGIQWKLVVPMSLEELEKQTNELSAEELVVYDEIGVGIGERIAFSEGAEAAMPFHPEVKPIDAYNAAIIDSLYFQ